MRFKHFSRKGYALFACVGREVIIGTLAVATLSHAKAEGISTRTETASDTLSRPEMKLDEVIVTGSRAPLTLLESAKMVSVISRDEIQRAAAESINDILKLATGVDVRQRGGFGVQTDIAVRGGNFDQITILLNGVNISSPHTGHLSADFPVSPDDIERIEILEGPSARIYGSSAFTGVINIVTRTPDDAISLHLAGGAYGYANANGSVHKTLGAWNSHLSGGYTRTDGATPNSYFTSSKAFYQGNLRLGDALLSAQVGYSYKPYAANTFYGASSTDQWESNERWITALNADIKLGKLHLAPQVYWNRWYDHYQWHKDNPAGENFHKVDASGVSLNSWFDSSLGKTSIGAEIRREAILSTKLGKAMNEADWERTGGHDAESGKYYKFKDTRTNASVFVEHDVLLERWTFSVGLLANMNDGLDTRWRLYPGIDISYRPDDNWKLYASCNMALRMPTFTDLYYSGANIEGNSNLKPEKTTDVQIGAKRSSRGYSAEVQLFYSHKTDMIDWVTYMQNDGVTTDNIFHSVNFQLDNVGAELNLQVRPQEIWGSKMPLRNVSLQYSYISQSSTYDVNVLQSKYAMDYLRHKIVVSANSRIWKNLNLNLSWRFQDRTGNANPSYAILDGKLSWDTPKYSLYAEGTNLLNKEYFDYTAIPQPKRWLRGGVKLTF